MNELAAIRTDRLWRIDTIASQYDVTHEVVQLENGNWGICTKPVLAAYEQQLQKVNQRNSFYNLPAMRRAITRRVT